MACVLRAEYCGFNRLSDEMVLRVFSELDAISLARMSQVSQRLCRLAGDWTFWQEDQLDRRFPNQEVFTKRFPRVSVITREVIREHFDFYEGVAPMRYGPVAAFLFAQERSDTAHLPPWTVLDLPPINLEQIFLTNVPDLFDENGFILGQNELDMEAVLPPGVRMISNDIVEQSNGGLLADHKALAATYGCTLPSVIEVAALCCLRSLTHVGSEGLPFPYSNNHAFTRCRETCPNGDPVFAGMRGSSLWIDATDAPHAEYIGVGLSKTVILF